MEGCLLGAFLWCRLVFLALFLLLGFGSNGGFLAQCCYILCLQHLLHNLLLLDQKGTDDAVANAGGTAAAAVGTADSLLGFGEAFVGGRSQRKQSLQRLAAVTALWSSALLGDVDVGELATGRLDDAHLVRGGIVGEAATIAEALHHYIKC